jgi:hypothetical protein
MIAGGTMPGINSEEWTQRLYSSHLIPSNITLPSTKEAFASHLQQPLPEPLPCRADVLGKHSFDHTQPGFGDFASHVALVSRGGRQHEHTKNDPICMQRASNYSH